MSLKPAVVIDGAIPRDSIERVEVVFQYTRDLILEEGGDIEQVADKLIELGRRAGRPLYQDDAEATEVEDDIINHINEILPDGWVCTVGEFTPGDVIVREFGHTEDEIRAIGF